MCIIFGLSLREKRMTIKGFRNTSVSLVICIIVGEFCKLLKIKISLVVVYSVFYFPAGILFGIPAHFISMFQGVSPYPTQEMSGRLEMTIHNYSTRLALFKLFNFF